MKKPVFLFSFFLIFFSMIFASCTVDVNLTLRQDGSVDVAFKGGSGEAFTKMILQATGSDGGTLQDSVDLKEVEYELGKAGFTNVKAEINGTVDIRLSMTDKNQSSYIFSSGIVSAKKGRLAMNITRESLAGFYAAADEQTRMILDLFLAPVFNGEEMSEEEYIEMLGTFYGENAAKEVQDSFLNITLTGTDGKSEKQRIPFSRLMCGNRF